MIKIDCGTGVAQFQVSPKFCYGVCGIMAGAKRQVTRETSPCF